MDRNGGLLLAPPLAYTHVLSSGTFGLPGSAKSVDWMVFNDTPIPQQTHLSPRDFTKVN